MGTWACSLHSFLHCCNLKLREPREALFLFVVETCCEVMVSLFVSNSLICLLLCFGLVYLTKPPRITSVIHSCTLVRSHCQ